MVKSKFLLLIVSVLTVSIVVLLLLNKTHNILKESRPETPITPSPIISSGPIVKELPYPSITLKPTIAIKSKDFSSPTPSLIITKPTSTPKPTPTLAPVQPTATPTPIQDTTPPELVTFGGPPDDSTVSFKNFCCPVYATDNSSGEIFIKFKFDNDPWSGWTKNFSQCYNNVSNGKHSLSIQLTDDDDNTTQIFSKTFSIEN